jgi:hypothetical protein
VQSAAKKLRDKGVEISSEIDDVPLVDLVPRHADETPLLALAEPEELIPDQV